MIKISNLTKIYRSKSRKSCKALDNINLTLPDSGLVFVLGKSGSGKSTLLNLIGGLDNITSGRIEVDGNDLSTFKEKDFCNYRNSHIGFIFQDYHLIDELTVYENIVLSLNLIREKDRGLVRKALERVDLSGYEDRYPTELSGGERQRVAIARAIVKNPRIILADEPTGNLDTHTATSIVNLLKSLSRECLILIVSHNVRDAYAYADRIIELSKGKTVLDISKNPNFSEQISVHNGSLIYPSGKQLEDNEINYINEHLARKRIHSILKRNDKYIPTQAVSTTGSTVKIKKKSLKLHKELGLSGKFLKNKTLAIALSSFMVSVIMVIMALAQTIIAFDAGEIISNEMKKSGVNSVSVYKLIDDERKELIGDNAKDFFVEIKDDEIQQFKDAGYNGDIYPVYNFYLPIAPSSSIEFAGWHISFLSNSLYTKTTLGVLAVDEAFLEEKFGNIQYIAKVDEFHPGGIIITDYIADSILLNNNNYAGKGYDRLIGQYHWGDKNQNRGYINAIIYTGYKERYADLIEKINAENINTLADLQSIPDFAGLMNEIYSYLGYGYSLEPDFAKSFVNNYPYHFVWQHKLMFDDIEYFDAAVPHIWLDDSIADNEILMPYKRYNEIYGTNYTASTINEFTPHTVTLSQYRYYDVENENKLCEIEVKIAGLTTHDSGTYYPTFFVNKNLFDYFAKNTLFVSGLYFDSNENIDVVVDISNELGYEQNMVAVEGIRTMTKAVDVFIPIFRLIAIILCVGVVFILVNFSTKMIKDKMHEIGILKAIGTSNKSVAVVFGLQILLIAVLTSIMTTIGYYYFIDIANDILIESLKQLAPSQVVLDLQFLTFKTDIAITNCILILLLAGASLFAPIIKIKNIKPVKIIKAKE